MLIFSSDLIFNNYFNSFLKSINNVTPFQYQKIQIRPNWTKNERKIRNGIIYEALITMRGEFTCFFTFVYLLFFDNILIILIYFDNARHFIYLYFFSYKSNMQINIAI